MYNHSARNRVSRLRTVIWQVLISLSIAILLAGCSSNGSSEAGKGGKGAGKGGRKGGGAVPVMVATSSMRDVPVEIAVVGNVEAYASIGIKPQVGGQLVRVGFTEGDFVKKGDLLFNIDPRPLEASLSQMMANNARDEAALGQAQANLARDSAQAKYSESQAARYAELFKSGIVSRDQSEQWRATADAQAQLVSADKAAVESARAISGASRATVENARVQLGFTTIVAPISGRTGSLAVKQGNVVIANGADMVTINQVEPIYVTFAVPETQLASVKKFMAQRKLVVRATPQDDPTSPQQGSLAFVDNAVDPATGMIKLKATFPNRDHKLWPGQFVRVSMQLTTRQNAVVVPVEAVQTGQDGSYVYVVKQDRTVESRKVTAGARVDREMVVETGLQTGETVVTEGQLRLAPGSTVVVRDGRGGRGGRGEAPPQKSAKQ